MTRTKIKGVPTAFNFFLLFGIWLLLANSLSVGNIILGVLLALFLPMLTSSVHTETPRVKKPLLAAKYLGVLLADILASNFVVAKQVLGSPAKLHPGFIMVPLDMREPLPITLLASTISLTPGTVSTEVSEDLSTLYVHALNVPDEEVLIAEIKQRYEAPLKEIFGC
jgi:multicomponent K+:H+ antiporter subunit E